MIKEIKREKKKNFLNVTLYMLQILSRANHLLRFCQKRKERERETRGKEKTGRKKRKRKK